MTTIYSASWVQPISEPLLVDGAVAFTDEGIVGVGSRTAVLDQFPEATRHHFPGAVIIPGLINTHTHLELTAMRGYLENEESNFFAWLKKLTVARMELMTPDDLYVAAAWGACEAVRAGITAVGDASDSSLTSISAIRDVGLRGIVFQESFGPDPGLAGENFEKLKEKFARLRELQTSLVIAGVSPHAPYTVCRSQLELIARFASDEKMPLMMHAAESADEESFLLDGCGIFAEGLTRRGIAFERVGTSAIRYLKQTGILETEPLLAHCIRVDEQDLEALALSGAKVAHCPKSNAKLGHGHAPFTKFLEKNIKVGLGSDSVGSNNTCDILEEARFAALLSRVGDRTDELEMKVGPHDLLRVATRGGAECLGIENQVGDLRPGMQADLAVLSLDGSHQLPVYDPVAATIFASSGRDVVATVIGGREVYRESKVQTVDEERLRERVKEIGRKLRDF